MAINLDWLETLEKRATPGPWLNVGMAVASAAEELDGRKHRLQDMMIVIHGERKPVKVAYILDVSCTTGEAGQESDNADFIAEIRNQAPDLIALAQLADMIAEQWTIESPKAIAPIALAELLDQLAELMGRP